MRKTVARKGGLPRRQFERSVKHFEGIVLKDVSFAPRLQPVEKNADEHARKLSNLPVPVINSIPSGSCMPPESSEM